MSLFGGSKGLALSLTSLKEDVSSKAVGDLSKQNIQAERDVTVNGLWGEDAQALLNLVDNIAGRSQELADLAFDKSTESAVNSANMAGDAIKQVAMGYQSAYSESTGMLQQIKPVLIAGVLAFALFYAYKIAR